MSGSKDGADCGSDAGGVWVGGVKDGIVRSSKDESCVGGLGGRVCMYSTKYVSMKHISLLSAPSESGTLASVSNVALGKLAASPLL